MSRFVFDRAPFAQCHASTIVALPGGDVLAAWFGGSAEGHDDTRIWHARRGGDGDWSEPAVLADLGPVPHWNPVLFAPPDAPLHLFFKTGRRISAWQAWMATSDDGGATWTAPREVVEGDRGGRGPVKNQPIVTADGAWLAPGSNEHGRWTCFVDISRDRGRTWTASEPIGDGVIQPTLWESEPGRVHMLMRSHHGAAYRSDSLDGGRTWGEAYATPLPNNNSGLDLAQLHDGTLVLAHNPVAENWGPRTPLVLTASRDGGATWSPLATLEDDAPAGAIAAGDSGVRSDGHAEFSYPTVIAHGDGVAVSYTWRRRRIAYAEVEVRP